MRRWEGSADLVAVAALVLLADILALAAPSSAARAAAGLAALLIAPGHALAAALFPGRGRVLRIEAGRDEETRIREEREGLSPLQRLALSLGLSVALAPLVGLALHFTPWGLREGPLLATVTVLVLALCAVAHLRRRRMGPARAFAFSFAALRPRIGAAWPDRALALAVAAGVLAAGGALAFVLQTPPPRHPFTELSLLGPDDDAGALPSRLAPGEAASLRVVVVNREGRALAYDARLVLGPAGNATDATQPREADAWAFTLEDGAARDERRAFTAPAEPGAYRVAVELRRAGDVEPYRAVHLVVTVAAPTPPG